MKYIYLILIFIISISLYAQDAHLSQFDATKIVLNPGETGMFKTGSYRAGTQYRNQWGIMSTKYSTSVIAYDMPLPNKALSPWGIGGYIVNNDAAKSFNTFKFVMGLAYRVNKPNNNYILSVGLHAGAIYKNANSKALTFDNQWNEGSFDSDMPTGENFSNEYKIMPEVNLGILYKGISEQKTFNPYIGLAIFHITNPSENFSGTLDSKLPHRYQLNGGLKISLSEKTEIDPGIFAQSQASVYEINAGLRGYYKFSEIAKLSTGVFYRIDDAVIVMLGLNYRNINFNMSYDINTSELKQYTDGRGAFEFSIVFISEGH